jgi:hypothetical protein
MNRRGDLGILILKQGAAPAMEGSDEAGTGKIFVFCSVFVSEGDRLDP